MSKAACGVFFEPCPAQLGRLIPRAPLRNASRKAAQAILR